MYDVLDEIRDNLATDLTTKIKAYWVGQAIAQTFNETPFLCVYAQNATHEGMGTMKDKTEYSVIIDIFTSSFGEIATAENSDKTQQAQKELWQLVEERDTDGKPLDSTIVGSLRKRIKGTKYMFTGNISIEYPTPQEEQNQWYFMARVNVRVVRKYNQRNDIS